MRTPLQSKMIKALALCLFFAFNYLTVNAQTPVSKNGQLKVIGTKLCNQYGNPIQLRGMSTHGIQWYSQCLTDASLDALAYDWGSDVLRIALYVQEGGYETDPVGYTNKVSALIEKATSRGMYAIVDWHQLTPGDPNHNLANAKRFFTDIANIHKNKVNIIYDIANEPNYVSWDKIKSYADQIIPVIRAIDDDAVILCGTHGWGSLGISDGRSTQDILNNPINFPNFMYTFHFYAASHGDQYYNELNYASDRLPIFISEFGTQTASGDGENNFTMAQKYIDLLRTKKISWANWNYSDDFRTGAVWKTGTCGNGPWTTAQLKPAGLWVRERMLSPADDFPGGTPNTPPTVSLTSPAAGATFTAPATVSIAATASDAAPGSVTKVEFYNGSTKLGEDLTSPYTFSWTSVPAGTYSITARAIDNQGAATNSAARSITVNGTTTGAPIPGTIQAEAYTAMSGIQLEGTKDTDGGQNVGWIDAGDWMDYAVNVSTAGSYTVRYRVASLNGGGSIQLRSGSTTLATTTVPSTGDWQIWTSVTTSVNLSVGSQTLRLYAVAGGFNINWIQFSTSNNCTASTITPNLMISGGAWQQTATATVNVGTSVVLGPQASTTGGSWSWSTGATTREITLPNSTAGTFNYTATYTNSCGAKTTRVFTITVNGTTTNTPPTVSWSSPASGASFTAPATITLTATASDAAPGTVSKVDFLNGNTLLFSDATAPYSYTWSNVPAGTYTITARATDNQGATASATRTFTVTGGTTCTVAAWSSTAVYTSSNRVSRNGTVYEAQWWTQNEDPATNSCQWCVWKVIGPCGSARLDGSETSSSALKLYPNPSVQGSNLHVELDQSYNNVQVTIENISGGRSHTYEFNNSNSVELTLPALPTGVNVIRIKADDKTFTRKVIIK